MPSIKRRAVLGASLAGLVPARRGLAQGAPVRIGVLNDQSGPYADLAGPGSALAVRMAAGDAGAAGLQRRVEVLTGDHQNKPDVGVSLIREWFAAGRVDCVVDVSNSAISLAAQPLAVQYDRLILHVSSTTSELAGRGCGARGVQWAQNTFADANGLARGLLRAGKTSYYFVTVDYAFGHAVEADMTAAVRAGGGTVTGGVRHPLNNGDLASFLASAQASGAQVVVLANSGADFVTAVKQAGEFGITRGQALAAPIVYLTDVHALGLDAAQGLQFVQSWYWDMDEPTRPPAISCAPWRRSARRRPGRCWTPCAPRRSRASTRWAGASLRTTSSPLTCCSPKPRRLGKAVTPGTTCKSWPASPARTRSATRPKADALSYVDSGAAPVRGRHRGLVAGRYRKNRFPRMVHWWPKPVFTASPHSAVRAVAAAPFSRR